MEVRHPKRFATRCPCLIFKKIAVNPAGSTAFGSSIRSIAGGSYFFPFDAENLVAVFGRGQLHLIALFQSLHNQFDGRFFKGDYTLFPLCFHQFVPHLFGYFPCKCALMMASYSYLWSLTAFWKAWVGLIPRVMCHFPSSSWYAHGSFLPPPLDA